MVYAPFFEKVLGLGGDELAAAVRRDFLWHAFVGEEEAERRDEAFRAAVGGAWLGSRDGGPA